MGGLLTAIFYTNPDVYNNWCDIHETFCLFSEGRANNLTEAQTRCKEISPDSWPVEIGVERVKEILDWYMKTYSISSVILNAKQRGISWMWIEDGSRVNNLEIVSIIGTSLIYKSDDYDYDYGIVCMIRCQADWTAVLGSRTRISKMVRVHIVSLRQCKSYCERSTNCSSVDWMSFFETRSCWAGPYPYNASSITKDIEYSHHAINRSNKTVSSCIGNYKGEEPILNWAILILLSIFGAVMVTILVVTSDGEADFFTMGLTSSEGRTPSHQPSTRSSIHVINTNRNAEINRLY